MNKFKFALLVIATLFYTYLVQRLFKNVDMRYLFEGVPFFSNWYVYFLNYFLVSILTLLVMGVSEEYVLGFGQYQLIRSQSTFSIVRQIQWKLISYLLLVELMKISMFVSISLVTTQSIILSDLNQFVFFLCLDSFFLCFLFSIQMYGELFFGSREALIGIQIFYLVSLVIGNILYQSVPHTIFNLLNPVSISMASRFDELKKISSLLYLTVPIAFIVSCIVMFVLTAILLKRKDWL